MMQRRNPDGALVVGGAALAAVIAAIFATRPAKAAPADEKLDYLIECCTAIVQFLGQLVQGQQRVIELLQQVAGVPGPPGVEVTVKTKWVAGEPEEIFRQAILSKGTFYSNRMVNWTQGKRLLIKVESSLNLAVQVQLIGNIVDTKDLATDIDGPLPCPANSNISIGPAWDDWHPYIGVRIEVAAAPASGILTVSAVIQE